MAKWKDYDGAEIKRLHAAGYSQRDIAAAVGMSPAGVHYVLKPRSDRTCVTDGCDKDADKGCTHCIDHRVGRKGIKDVPCIDCGRLCFRSGRNARDENHRCWECRRKRIVGVCEQCDKEFRRHHARRGTPRSIEPVQRFCSNTCAGTAKRQGEYRGCAGGCGESVWCSPYRLKHQQNFYCADCWKTLFADRIAAERPSGDRERAEYWGVAYEPIDRPTIYNHDKWICQLCHEQVDPKLKLPDQMCASLDHIIPMSRGGPHLYTNVQLAHLLCNMFKGNRGDYHELATQMQVRLVPAKPPGRSKQLKPAPWFCEAPGCDRLTTRQYCGGHEKRLKLGKPLGGPLRKWERRLDRNNAHNGQTSNLADCARAQHQRS